MLRSFLRDAWIYGATTFFGKGLSLLLLPVWTRHLTPADFGWVEMGVTVSAFVNVLVTQEISQAVARYLPATAAMDRPRIVTANLHFLAKRYGWAVVAFLFLWLVSSYTPYPLPNSTTLGSLLLYVLGMWLFYALVEQLRWGMWADRYAKAQVMAGAGSALCTFVLVVLTRAGLVGFLWGQTAGYALACAYILSSDRAWLRQQPDPATLRTLLAFARPLVIPAFLAVGGIYADRILIQTLLGNHALGLYSVALRLGLVVTLLLQIFQMPLMPLIYKHQAEPATPLKIAQITHIFVLCLHMVIAGLALFSQEIMAIVTPPVYWQGHVLLPWVALKLVFMQMYAFTPGLSIANRTDVLGRIHTAGAIVIMGLSALGAWVGGLAGVVVAGAIGAICFVGIYGYYGQKVYAIPYPFRKMAASALLLGVVLVAVPFIPTSPDQPWLSLVLKGAIWSVFLFSLADVRHSRLL